MSVGDCGYHAAAGSGEDLFLPSCYHRPPAARSRLKSLFESSDGTRQMVGLHFEEEGQNIITVVSVLFPAFTPLTWS